MNPSYYGKRRAVSLEFRLTHVKTGETIILYPGQLKDFCRKHDLNYASVMVARCRRPNIELPIYSIYSNPRRFKPALPKASKVVFMLQPASVAQVRP